MSVSAVAIVDLLVLINNSYDPLQILNVHKCVAWL